MTKEATAPGFYHNLHSINHFHISETPWFKDLGLEDRVTYITPRYEFGQAHRDGTALVFGRDREETIANVARFSKKDADDLPRLEPPRRGDHRAHPHAGTLCGAIAAVPNAKPCWRKRQSGATFSAISRRQPLDVVRRAVRERSRQAPVPVQSVAVRHLADRYAVKDEPDGIGHPRLRSGDRLPALPRRLVQSRARTDGDFHRGGRHISAAGR